MKKRAFLAVIITLSVSGCLWAAQPAQGTWSAPSDGAGPDDTAAEHALAAEGAEVDKGTILFEYYWGADGSVSSLEGLPTFPNYADDREWRASLEGPTDWRDHYGTYVRGYLYPPGTGSYTFWIASDDQSQLWLSTDEDPAHIRQIASVSVWTPPRDFDNIGGGFGGSQQKSSPIPLTAGKRYYIEVLYAEGIGGDNLAVAWQRPGIRDRTIITGEYLSPITGPTDVIDPDLIGWWKLEEGSGATVQDSSGHNKHGTIHNSNGGLGLNGAVWVSDPERGTVLSFNGDDATGAYVDAGTIAAMDLAGGFTWTFWAKQDVAQSTAVPGGGNDVMLGNRFGGTETPLQFVKFTPTKFEYFNDYDLMAIDYQDIPGGQWVHHAVVKTGATLTYYRDGVEAGTTTLTKTMAQNPFFMGGDAGGERWRGWLSDVRIYDRDLSAAEIRALINAVRGEYFTNMTLFGSPAVTRLDPQIYFNWAGEVFPGTWDQCSVRWTGEVEAAFTEPYTFYVNTDDGVRLWLNGFLIIDAWWDQAATEHASTPIQLVAGQKYPLRLEWYDNTLSGTCELRWSSPSTPKQVIPSARLHPPAPSAGGGTSSGNPTVTLNPPSGPVGTLITITGSGFPASTGGSVISTGVSTWLITEPDGTFSTTLTVPQNVPGGNYPIRADFPIGEPTEASATFTVEGSLTLSPASGAPSTSFTVAGIGFPANASGRVFIDGNRNNAWDPGESYQDLVTTPTGTFPPVGLTVPPVQFGPCYVYAQFPSGSTKASAVFWVTSQITLNTTSGPTSTTIWVTGTGFAPSTSGNVTLAGTTKSVTTSPTGTFFTSITVPTVPGGNHSVGADIPSGGSQEASADFTVVPQITLSPMAGRAGTNVSISGTGFRERTAGRVFCDVNRNGRYDSGEPSLDVMTTLLSGTFTETLRVPVGTPAGYYDISADCPIGSPIEDSETFRVVVGP